MAYIQCHFSGLTLTFCMPKLFPAAVELTETLHNSAFVNVDVSSFSENNEMLLKLGTDR